MKEQFFSQLRQFALIIITKIFVPYVNSAKVFDKVPWTILPNFYKVGLEKLFRLSVLSEASYQLFCLLVQIYWYCEWSSQGSSWTSFDFDFFKGPTSCFFYSKEDVCRWLEFAFQWSLLRNMAGLSNSKLMWMLPNISKLNYLTIKGGCNFVFDDIPIDHVQYHKDVGLHISSNLKWSYLDNQGLRKARKAFFHMKSIPWSTYIFQSQIHFVQFHSSFYSSLPICHLVPKPFRDQSVFRNNQRNWPMGSLS